MLILLLGALVLPSLAVLAALELSTPSPVYLDLASLRFRRHDLPLSRAGQPG